MRVPHPIPYQGSKRNLAPAILAYMPDDTRCLIEPFAGSAAVSLAAARSGKARSFRLNDINRPLVRLWQEIIERPQEIADAYEQCWNEQQGRERKYYVEVRDCFNHTHEPALFLYLLARCVKASVRYNSSGEFNQSPDNRRQGARPATMREHVAGASCLLKGRTELSAAEYADLFANVKAQDVVYMDPPYQGVCGERDRRYIGGIETGQFIETLRTLNANNVSYILSYDGQTGGKSFGKPLPATLNLTHILLEAGRSSQATLLGRDDHTIESLYLSPALVARLPTIIQTIGWNLCDSRRIRR